MLFEDKISKAEEFSTAHPDRRLEIEGNSVTKIAEERITEIVSVERNSQRAIMKTNQSKSRGKNHDLSPTPPEVMECNEFNIAANESVGGGNESGRDGPQSATPPPQLKEEEHDCERVILEGIKETEGEPDSELFTEWTKDNKKKFTRDQLMDYDLKGTLCIDETLLSNEFDESIQIGNHFQKLPIRLQTT